MTPDHLPALDVLENYYVRSLGCGSRLATQLVKELVALKEKYAACEADLKETEIRLASIRSLKATLLPSASERVDL